MASGALLGSRGKRQRTHWLDAPWFRDSPGKGEFGPLPQKPSGILALDPFWRSVRGTHSPHGEDLEPEVFLPPLGLKPCRHVHC